MKTNKTKRAKGGGRKPKGPIAGKILQLTTRITPQTDAALHRRMAEMGWSKSQVVEWILAAALSEPVGMADRIWGNAKHPDRWRANKALGVMIGKAVAAIEDYSDRSWRRDIYTYRALGAAIANVLGRLAPVGELEAPERIRQHFPQWEDPQALGTALALGLLDQLTMHPAVPMPSPKHHYADDYYQFPQLRRDLGINGEE